MESVKESGVRPRTREERRAEREKALPEFWGGHAEKFPLSVREFHYFLDKNRGARYIDELKARFPCRVKYSGMGKRESTKDPHFLVLGRNACELLYEVDLHLVAMGFRKAVTYYKKEVEGQEKVPNQETSSNDGKADGEDLYENTACASRRPPLDSASNYKPGIGPLGGLFYSNIDSSSSSGGVWIAPDPPKVCRDIAPIHASNPPLPIGLETIIEEESVDESVSVFTMIPERVSDGNVGEYLIDLGIQPTEADVHDSEPAQPREQRDYAAVLSSIEANRSADVENVKTVDIPANLRDIQLDSLPVDSVNRIMKMAKDGMAKQVADYLFVLHAVFRRIYELELKLRSVCHLFGAAMNDARLAKENLQVRRELVVIARKEVERFRCPMCMNRMARTALHCGHVLCGRCVDTLRGAAYPCLLCQEPIKGTVSLI